MSLIHNERTKLTATWLNTAGASSITLGVIAPLAAAVFGYPSPAVSVWNLLVGVVFWLFTGVAPHLLARKVLGRLRP